MAKIGSSGGRRSVTLKTRSGGRTTKASVARPRTSTGGRRSSGPDLGKQLGQGISRVGQALDRALPTTRGFKPPSTAQSRKNNAVLRSVIK